MVANAPANGYTLLYAAENPAIYRTLGLSKLSFNDFEPILIPIDGVTMQDLVNATETNKKIKMATSGTGGLPYVAGAMMRLITARNSTISSSTATVPAQPPLWAGTRT